MAKLRLLTARERHIDLCVLRQGQSRPTKAGFDGGHHRGCSCASRTRLAQADTPQLKSNKAQRRE
jgi:hypothetical protein